MSTARSDSDTVGTPKSRGRGSPVAEIGGSPASVAAIGISHVFDSTHSIFKQLDLTVTAGEFWTLLGPSGSGKTTLLRILAGLIAPAEGKVCVGGVDVTALPVQERNIGFVFQHYALFPHLTVAQNIAFPLTVRRLARAEREKKVAQALELVELASLGNRYPSQLSGGQQQRVAVARALVYDPKVLLLDEPLGALDLRLRQQLGADLRRIQQQTGTTAIYVTHDQGEAFLLSDVVVVMNEGRIHQVGAPADVYTHPADSFVANFLGETNVLSGTVAAISDNSVTLVVNGVSVRCSRRAQSATQIGSVGNCSVRPEDVEIYRADDLDRIPDGHCVFGVAEVDHAIFLGSRFRVSMRMGQLHILAELHRQSGEPQTDESWLIAWKDGVPVFVTE